MIRSSEGGRATVRASCLSAAKVPRREPTCFCASAALSLPAAAAAVAYLPAGCGSAAAIARFVEPPIAPYRPSLCGWDRLCQVARYATTQSMKDPGSGRSGWRRPSPSFRVCAHRSTPVGGHQAVQVPAPRGESAARVLTVRGQTRGGGPGSAESADMGVIRS
jgi:hypothetical protein